MQQVSAQTLTAKRETPIADAVRSRFLPKSEGICHIWNVSGTEASTLNPQLSTWICGTTPAASD